MRRAPATARPAWTRPFRSTSAGSPACSRLGIPQFFTPPPIGGLRNAPLTEQIRPLPNAKSPDPSIGAFALPGNCFERLYLHARDFDPVDAHTAPATPKTRKKASEGRWD